MADTKLLVDLTKPEGDPDRERVVPLSDDELAQRDVDEAAAAAAEQAEVERAWVELRMKRDRWIAQTDWIVATLPADLPAAIADAVAANLDAWKAFRQALRDLPETTTDPRAAAWPAQPAAPVVHLT